MSRYTISHQDKALAFGKDHACGLFLQIWSRPKDASKRKLQDVIGPEGEDMLVDKDDIDDFSDDDVLDLIEAHGFELSEFTPDPEL